MNLANYASFFQDGSIIGFDQDNSELIISMESREISEDDLDQKLTLSEFNTLKGKLHLRSPNIWIDGKPFLSKISMLADSYFILDFGFKENELNFFVQLVNYKKNRDMDEYLEIKVNATDIYWESLPNLYDPFKQGSN